MNFLRTHSTRIAHQWFLNVLVALGLCAAAGGAMALIGGIEGMFLLALVVMVGVRLINAGSGSRAQSVEKSNNNWL